MEKCNLKLPEIIAKEIVFGGSWNENDDYNIVLKDRIADAIRDERNRPIVLPKRIKTLEEGNPFFSEWDQGFNEALNMVRCVYPNAMEYDKDKI